MKSGIHPKYVPTTIVCTCGNSFVTRSTDTGGSINVEVCSNCHPFYTGKQKILDTGGRVARFQARYAKQAEAAKAKAAKAEKDAAAKAKESTPVAKDKTESTPAGRVDVDDAPIEAIDSVITDEQDA
jgi:large subunit ribosomal protein L31